MHTRYLDTAGKLPAYFPDYFTLSCLVFWICAKHRVNNIEMLLLSRAYTEPISYPVPVSFQESFSWEPYMSISYKQVLQENRAQHMQWLLGSRHHSKYPSLPPSPHFIHWAWCHMNWNIPLVSLSHPSWWVGCVSSQPATNFPNQCGRKGLGSV